MRRLSCNMLAGVGATIFSASAARFDKKPLDSRIEEDPRWLEEQARKAKTPEEIYAEEKQRREIEDLAHGKTQASKFEHHAERVGDVKPEVKKAAPAAGAAAAGASNPNKKNPFEKEDPRWLEEQFNEKAKTPEERYAEEKQRHDLHELSEAIKHGHPPHRK